MIAGIEQPLDAVLQKHERWEIPGRMNLSAGGPWSSKSWRRQRAVALAKTATSALGLRVAAVDLSTGYRRRPGSG